MLSTPLLRNTRASPLSDMLQFLACIPHFLAPVTLSFIGAGIIVVPQKYAALCDHILFREGGVAYGEVRDKPLIPGYTSPVPPFLSMRDKTWQLFLTKLAVFNVHGVSPDTIPKSRLGYHYTSA